MISEIVLLFLGMTRYQRIYLPSVWALSLSGAYLYAQNVGIGTPAPTHRLHVAGGGRFDDVVELLRPADGTNAAVFNLHNPTTGRFWHTVVRSGDADKLQWYRWNGSSWLHVMTMDMNGQVGIGTANPAQRLHVAGTMRSDNVSGAHPSSQTYSNIGTNADGDIIRVNPTHGYLFTVVQPCDLTVEGTIRAQITGGTLTIDCYNEGGGFQKRCYTLSGVANARIVLLITNDDTGNCGGTARMSGVRELTVTNGGGTVSVATDLGCNGSDGNNWTLFVHYNPL